MIRGGDIFIQSLALLSCFFSMYENVIPNVKSRIPTKVKLASYLYFSEICPNMIVPIACPLNRDIANMDIAVPRMDGNISEAFV